MGHGHKLIFSFRRVVESSGRAGVVTPSGRQFSMPGRGAAPRRAGGLVRRDEAGRHRCAWLLVCAKRPPPGRPCLINLVVVLLVSHDDNISDGRSFAGACIPSSRCNEASDSSNSLLSLQSCVIYLEVGCRLFSCGVKKNAIVKC